MASTTETNFGNFYNNSPNVIILDTRGIYYNFSNTAYNNGYGGSSCSESDSKNYANGRKFGNFRDGDPWNLCWMVDMANYTNKGSTVSDIPDDNAWDDETLAVLNNIAKDNIPGYKLKSGGSYKNNSHDYIVADRGTGYYNFSFSLYTKKTDIEFFNDFINVGGDTKTKFLTMVSNTASYGNQRYNVIPDAACNNSAMPQAGKKNCATGAAQWCRDSTDRIWGNAASTLTSANKCYPYVQNGSLDAEVTSTCTYDLDILNNTFCKDQRLNSGSVNIKNALAAKLATTSFCGNDTNINDTKCVDVKNACSSGNNAFDNTTMPNYQCNTLIKSLNNSNKIAMLANTNIKTLSATWTQPLKTALISSFNTESSTTVSDALCNLATNSTDRTCTEYIQSNFSGLVQSNDTNPILVMYFAGDNFTVPAGMSSHNSLSISSINKTSGIGTKAPATTLPTIWCAKLYVYITPSTTDNYTFKINVDDDAKLYLNNTLIIDTWGKTCCTDYISTAAISLNPANGPYLLCVEYRDKGGQSNITVSYKPSPATAVYANLADILPENKSKFGASPIAGLTVSTLYMSSFNPYNLTNTARAIQSIAYCTTSNRFATDASCLGSATNGYVGINKNHIQDYPAFKTSILDYCTTDNRFATDTSFCNNTNYKSYILNNNNTHAALNTAMGTYCELPANNTYATGTTSSYCKTTDNANTNNYNNTDSTTKIMNNTYADKLRTARLKYVNSAISTSLAATGNTKGTISKDVEDYITTYYPNIQTRIGKTNNPNSAIIPSSLYSYCENKPITPDPTEQKTSTAYYADSLVISGGNTTRNYYNNWYIEFTSGKFSGVRKKIISTILQNVIVNGAIGIECIANLDSRLVPKSEGDGRVNYSSTINLYRPETEDLCDVIYNTYNTDPNIIASAQRKADFKVGIQSNAFMGRGSNTSNNAKYLAERDSPEKFAVYLPYAINYCATGDNVVSAECQTYYNNINGVISQGINKQYTNASTSVATPSAFTNKEPFCNGRSESNYDDETIDSKECKDSNMLYIFLLFLFVIVMAISFGAISNCRNFNYNRQYNNIKSTY